MYTSAQNTPFPEQLALHKDRIADAEDAVKIGAERPNPDENTDHRNRTNEVRKSLAHVPDRPDILYEEEAVNKYLQDELATEMLDALYPHLWSVARNEGKHIDALHFHLLKNRTIVVSEDPQLHLIWTAKSVYVKPIPPCLLNYDFWETFLAPCRPAPSAYHGNLSIKTSLFRKQALGFLRSYHFLIQHRSDFNVAQQYGLLPSYVDYLSWVRFAMCFRKLADSEVSTRYHYGQVRLSRLNWAVRIFGDHGGESRWYYTKPYWSISPYIKRAAAPLAFLFGALSLILSAMQVILGATAVTSGAVGIYSRVFWTFSIIVILASVLALVLFVLLPGAAIWNQLRWGYQHRSGKTHDGTP